MLIGRWWKGSCNKAALAGQNKGCGTAEPEIDKSVRHQSVGQGQRGEYASTNQVRWKVIGHRVIWGTILGVWAGVPPSADVGKRLLWKSLIGV